MTREKAIEVLKKWYKLGNEGLTDERLGYVESWFSKEDKEAFILTINVLCCFDQILWERDMAISQLKELGYSLGEKKKTCEGCQYEWNSYNEEECRYCNRFGSDRYRQKEEDEEDEDDEC